LGIIHKGEVVAVGGRVRLIAFSIAGATTFTLMRLTFWRLKANGVPRTFGTGARRGLTWGLLGGSSAALVAFVYLMLAMHTPLLEYVRETVLTGREAVPWLVALAVVAAPIFGELIFRGLIFGGLRRSWGLPASVWQVQLSSPSFIHLPR
jgi:membrane protease YdiL (CAAX protease family)